MQGIRQGVILREEETMKHPSASRFYNLCEEEVKLVESLVSLRDNRARPAIEMPTIAKSCIYSPVFGFDSLMQVDFFSHKHEAKKLGIKPISDSLIEKTSSGVHLQYLNEVFRMLYAHSKAKGLLKINLSNPTKPVVTVAHADGTYWMTHYFTFITLSGAIEQVLKLRWMANIGEELKQTQICVNQAIVEYGPGFCDILTLDGKYVDFGYLKNLPRYNIDYFVRIRGDDGRNLEIVRQIEHKICSNEQDITIQEGIDLDMNCKYKVYRVRGISEKRLGQDILGMKIELTYMKGERKGEKETHYAFTSALYLAVEDLYIVRKCHWRIETLFRDLKREFWSRHAYLPTVRQV